MGKRYILQRNKTQEWTHYPPAVPADVHQSPAACSAQPLLAQPPVAAQPGRSGE